MRYFITDHLGSVRAVVNADGEVVEQNDYMPYGTLHANSALQNGDNLYLYGGKELQADFGVNYYDSFARFQRNDGAFNSIDPKAENYFHISPYAYCAGNPINTVDVDGRVIETAIDVGFVLYDVGAAIVQHIRGNHQKAKQHWKDAGYNTAAAIVPGMPAGASKVVRAVGRHADEAAKTTKYLGTLRNADNIVEGIAYEKEMLARAKESGGQVAEQVTLEINNGKGYIKGNITRADQLIKNPDGSFSIVETKLTNRTRLTKDQRTAKAHVDGGDQYFIVHTNNDALGIHKRDNIQITNYSISTKYIY